MNKENMANNLEKDVEVANAIAAETRLHFDTLVQMQMEERQQAEKRHFEEKKQLRSHYGKIIAGLIITLSILLTGIFGGLLYLFSNYDIGVVYQQQTVDGGGSADINDGLYYNNY